MDFDQSDRDTLQQEDNLYPDIPSDYKSRIKEFSGHTDGENILSSKNNEQEGADQSQNLQAEEISKNEGSRGTDLNQDNPF